MIYRLKVDSQYPLFSAAIPTIRVNNDWNRTIHHAPKKTMQERPKMMKKLIRVVKRTKGVIASVKSIYQGNTWVKVIEVR